MGIPDVEGGTLKKILITVAAIVIVNGVQYGFHRLQEKKWDKQADVYEDKISALDKEKTAFEDSLLVQQYKIESLKASLLKLDSTKNAQINKLEKLAKKHENSINAIDNANSDELGSFFTNYKLNTGN